MGPYLAVVSDSFRAAFSSRILWVAIAAIYVFLFAVAPIGYREVMTTTIRWFDFSNGTRMKAMLAQDIDQSKPTPAGQIARALPEEIRANLRKVAEGEEIRIRLDLLADALTGLLEREDWYDATVWKNTTRLRELRELEAAGSTIDAESRRRLARLRIESALPGVFESRGARSIALTYAGFDFPAVFQIAPDQFKLLLNHFVLRIIIDWVLGFVMIFLGILVTASIVPDMLQPGSLHLLLSKPISRTLLFLAKFVGGCAFVLVCVTQLIVGLWLICGWRLDIWNPRLLLCIPVCVFLFAVFYSVSAVAGLRWRSPILAIGLANAFGALCLIVGVAGGVSDGFITQPDRIESMAVSGDTIVTATRGGALKRFEPTQKSWTSLFPEAPGGGDRILPPVALPDGRIATARVRSGRMNVFGSGATATLLLDQKDDWLPTPSIELPTSTAQLFTTPQGELIALNSSELMVADAAAIKIIDSGASDRSDKAALKVDHNPDTETTEKTSKPLFSKLLKMMGVASDSFRPLAPAQISLVSPRSIAIAADGNSIFIYASGNLVRLDRPTKPNESGSWTLIKSVILESGNEPAFLRLIGDELILMRSESTPEFYSLTLEKNTTRGFDGFDFSKFKIGSAISCDGFNSVVVVSIDGLAFLLQTTKGSSGVAVSPIGGVSDIDALTWDKGQSRLWLSHHVDQLAAIDIAKNEIVTRYSPRLTGWRLVDRYVVTPLRTLTPQTGELSETIAAIVSGQSTIELPMIAEAPPIERYNVWRPVLTCAAFITMMLTIGCVYFSRADF